VKKNLLIILLLPLLAFDSGEKYLEKIPAYQKDSYFKTKVYAEHDWKSFFKMPEPNKIIEPDNYDLHLLNAAVFYATNKLREEKGLATLKYSGALRDAALVHTNQMIEKKFLDHFNHFNLALRSPEQRLKIFGSDNTEMAENIDLTFIVMPSKTTYLQIAQKILDDLYHSPPHKKNMMNKIYSSLGCAAMFESKDKQGVRYVKATQDFSRP
jgi:uncharacterized protein YkwD